MTTVGPAAGEAEAAMAGDDKRVDIEALLARSGEALSVRRVFGEPVERDGVTVIPAARVIGGAGGGGGNGPHEQGSGGGGGFGVHARPVGAYVIRDGVVTWERARDPERIVLAAFTLAAFIAWILRPLFRRA